MYCNHSLSSSGHEYIGPTENRGLNSSPFVYGAWIKLVTIYFEERESITILVLHHLNYYKWQEKFLTVFLHCFWILLNMKIFNSVMTIIYQFPLYNTSMTLTPKIYLAKLYLTFFLKHAGSVRTC